MHFGIIATSPSGADGQFACAACRLGRLSVTAGSGFDQAAEDLDVEPGGAAGSRLPLHADGEPVVARPLDRFDDAVECAGADDEARGQTLDGLAVFAVDDNLAFAIEVGQLRARLDIDGM